MPMNPTNANVKVWGLLLSLILVMLMIVPILPLKKVSAATYTVNTLDDHDDGHCTTGDCTLREAINAARDSCWDAVDTIEFDPSLSGTIRLKPSLGPLPDLTCPMVIDGDGRITISGDYDGDGVADVDHAFNVIAWDGSGIDPDIEITGLTFERFTSYSFAVTPQGQVYVHDVEVRYSGIGISIYSTSYSDSRLRVELADVHDNSLQGIYVRVSGSSGKSAITISKSYIYSNGQQGIWLDGTASGVEFYNVRIGDPSDSSSGNYVYSNGAEGILLSGNVHDSYIYYNKVGMDDSSNRAPNGDGPGSKGDGGIVLANGPYGNKVKYNEVAWHYYQNIALVGSGTDSNVLSGNYVHCDPTLTEPQCYIGILVSEGASKNVIGGDSSNWNIVTGHRYEGIAVYGQGTDGNEISYNKVGAFDSSGSYTGKRDEGNGAGIGVLSEASPHIHFPFPVYATDPSYYHQGPANTEIHHNNVTGNHGNGIILVWTTGFDIYRNNVTDNSGNGIYWIGSTGKVHDKNNITDNDLSGIRVEPFWGYEGTDHPALSPSTYDDDVLSQPTDPNGYGIYGNSIKDNGEYGVYVVDNPWIRLDYLKDPSKADNQLSGNSEGDARKVWFGYAKVEDADGNPVMGKTVEVLRDDGDYTADYTSTTYDSQGRYGPSNFNYNDVTTWFQILEEEITSSGEYKNYNPYEFRISGSLPIYEFYSWDGKYPNPPGESGGATESPQGSGAYRYQYAKVTYRKAEQSPYAGKVVINEILYRQCSCTNNNESIELYFNGDVDISGWKITDGSEGLDCSGHFEFTFPSGSVYHKGDYVIVWIGPSGNAPWADGQYRINGGAGCRCLLNNKGDDIWLLDSSGKVVDYVAYGSDGGIKDASPPGMWDGNNAPAPSDYMQSISLTPNGKYSDSGLDWELTTSGTASGPVTVDTDESTCKGYEAKDSLGRNNNHLIDLMVKPSGSGLYVYDDVYEYPYKTQKVSATTQVGEKNSFSVKFEYEMDGGGPLTSNEGVQLGATYSCPGWSITFYDGDTPISLPAQFTLTPSNPDKELKLIVKPGKAGSCNIVLTLSYHDDVKGYDIPYDEALINVRAVEVKKVAQTCEVKGYLNATDVLDGYPVGLGDTLEYNLTIESHCDKEVEVEAVIQLPDGVNLIKENLTAYIGEITYMEAENAVIWKGKVPPSSKVNVSSFNVTVGRVPLGYPVIANSTLECLSTGCKAVKRSDDPLTPPEYDPTIRPVTEMNKLILPAGTAKIPVNLTLYGTSKVIISNCEGWNLSFNGGPLEEFIQGSGTLEVKAPPKAKVGDSCTVVFVPRHVQQLIYWPMHELKIQQLVLNLSVAPILRARAYLDITPRKVRSGGLVHLLLTVDNEGDVDLPIELDLPLNGLRALGILYHMGGKVSTRNRLEWVVTVPPWSSRKIDVVAIAPLAGGNVKLQGEVHVIGRNVTFMTDDPKTAASEDPTLLEVTSLEHVSSGEEVTKTSEQAPSSSNISISAGQNTSPSSAENTSTAQQEITSNSSVGESIQAARGREGVRISPKSSLKHLIDRLSPIVMAFFTFAILLILMKEELK